MKGVFIFIYVVIACFSLAESSDISSGRWYSREVFFSDWRNVVPVDRSSNMVVCNWYSPHHARNFRNENAADVIAELESGKTIRIGLDYYALFFPVIFAREDIGRNLGRRLMRGEVIVLDVSISGGVPSVREVAAHFDNSTVLSTSGHTPPETTGRIGAIRGTGHP